MSSCEEVRGLYRRTLDRRGKSAFNLKMLFGHGFSWLNVSVFIIYVSLDLLDYLRVLSLGLVLSFKNSNYKDSIMASLQ